MNRVIAIAVLAAAGLTSGCVNVTAPDKPIVINLNITITQAVVYRLDGEAKTLIQQNPGIF
ncbi:YnbE family lipoprotein [Sphingomonas sp. AR_OL41]|uniref:YnbE family lipoprotein n=1 Tax=Parasphingomonas halimpatiens TaxID=3096162 RepID=UPI0024814561|nr:YnbE family lipoprotein [Sphingomonas sp. AR_OL41]MDH7973076.1 YnbE family lipoprotein [Sphingomonas sp. AR_OL41]